MKPEYLDIYDENMNYIGILTRNEVHKKGHWHQVIHCWLVQKEGEKEYIIFQKRHEEKDSFPKFLDITAAGHLLAGETPQDGIREVEEELGIHVVYEDLLYFGMDREFWSKDGYINKEFYHLFLGETKANLEEFVLQKEEVSGIIKIEIDDALKLFEKKVPYVLAKGYIVEENENKLWKEYSVNKSDFVPHDDLYYIKILTEAKKYFK